jgi:hypothetical protein
LVMSATLRVATAVTTPSSLDDPIANRVANELGE